MTTKNHDGLRATMATLAKMKINELRAAYTRTTGKPANRLGRDALIKSLATSPTSAPPAKAATPKQASPAPTTPPTGRKTGARDPRLPAPGTVLEREFKGKVHKVTVKQDGFDYAGKHYASLTAAAKVATGYPSISGTLFWGIAKPATRKATKG